MAQTGVLLRISCHDGQVVVTDERVFMRGLSQSSEELWSVPRARVAGVQAHAGLIHTELTVRTRDGETYNATKVGASDALLAIGLLGYVPERAAHDTASATKNQAFELVCGDARLSVGDTEVEWTGERPWRLLRKEVAGVSARTQSPFTELAVHTFSGRICRATHVPVYGAVRVVELLGYMGAQTQTDKNRAAAQGAASGASKARRATAQVRGGKVNDTRATRRAVRAGASSLSDAPRPSRLSALLARLHLKRA